jgi:hypothetical protein
MRLISALAYNTTFGAYEHVFPFFPALVRLISALLSFLNAFPFTPKTLPDTLNQTVCELSETFQICIRSCKLM